MFVTAAWFLGLTAVFLVAAGLSIVILRYGVLPLAYRLKKRSPPTSYREDMHPPLKLTEDNIEKIAIAVGIIAALLALALMFLVPQKTAFRIMGILSVIGVITGILSFAVNKQ